MKIKAVIFDLNGVFIISPKLSDRFQQKYGISSDDFFSALQNVLSVARLPHCDDSFLLWKKYFDSWKLKISKEEFFDFWFGAEMENIELVNIAKDLQKRGVKVIILSNNFKERAEYYEKTFPFLKTFDGLYYSWQTGFVKPDPRAFQKVLEDFKLKPEECLYFDDSDKNVESAKSIGMRAFVFEAKEDLLLKLGTIK